MNIIKHFIDLGVKELILDKLKSYNLSFVNASNEQLLKAITAAEDDLELRKQTKKLISIRMSLKDLRRSLES